MALTCQLGRRTVAKFRYFSKNRQRNKSKFCISVPFQQNCGNLRDSELRNKHGRSRILTSVPENAMTRATEFCDQHGLMPLCSLLMRQGSKVCAPKAGGVLEVFEPPRFAFRFAVAKQQGSESSDLVVPPGKPNSGYFAASPAEGCRLRHSAKFRNGAKLRNASRPDRAGIGGIRLIEDWIDPSGTKLAIPMLAG